MEHFIITTARQLHLPNMFNYMAPVLIVLVIAEWILSAFEEDGRYTSRDTLADVLLGVGNLVVIGSIKIGFISMVITGYNLTPVRLPVTWWSVTLCFLLLDFTGYWAHRISHETRVFWAAHVTHHSSEKFNLAINFRNGWTSHITLMFYIPSMFMGLNPWVFMITYQLHQIYQFWIHTEYIGKLPRIFEYILVTPSHHRVHHASNENYLDKNFGIALIIWDRLFGTFTREVDKPRYGLTKPVNSYNPIYLNFHEWREIFRDVSHSVNFRQAWLMLFARPSDISRIKNSYQFIPKSGNPQNTEHALSPVSPDRRPPAIRHLSGECLKCPKSCHPVRIESSAQKDKQMNPFININI